MESAKVMVGGKDMELTHHEMKEIADKYWEHWGKHSMLDYAKKMMHKANENIAEALGVPGVPEDEDDVKEMISEAISSAMLTGDFDMLAEVLYESSERAAACFAYKNIVDED